MNIVAQHDQITCPVCGHPFTPKRKGQQTCGVRCRNTATSRATAEWRSLAMWLRSNGDAYPQRGGRPTHRGVMEEMLGRPPTTDEIGHHDDRVKRNARPENIRIMSRAEHCKEHQAELQEAKRRKAAGIVRVTAHARGLFFINA